MKTQIFAYKDYLGINASDDVQPHAHFDAGGVIPVCSVPLADVEFSKEAVDLLKTFSKSENGLGNFFLHIDTENDKTVVWAGTPKSALSVKDSQLVADFDFSELSIVEMEVPQEFKDFVDNNPEN